jgi:hypothetical protein
VDRQVHQISPYLFDELPYSLGPMCSQGLSITTT